MIKTKGAGLGVLGTDHKLPRKSTKEMPNNAFDRSAPADWAAIRWADFDRAAEPQTGSPWYPWRRPSSTARICRWEPTPDRRSLITRARPQFLPKTIPATFLPVQAVGLSTGHTDFPGTLTLSDPSRPPHMDGARRGRRRKGGRQEAGHGDQPRRQQRGDGPGRAGSSCATRRPRSDDRMGSFRRARKGSSQRRSFGTASMAGPSRHRSCWRAIRQQVRRSTGSRISVSPAGIAMEKRISLALDASSRAIGVAGAGSSSAWGRRRRNAGVGRQGKSAPDRPRRESLLRTAGRRRSIRSWRCASKQTGASA